MTKTLLLIIFVKKSVQILKMDDSSVSHQPVYTSFLDDSPVLHLPSSVNIPTTEILLLKCYLKNNFLVLLLI